SSDGDVLLREQLASRTDIRFSGLSRSQGGNPRMRKAMIIAVPLVLALIAVVTWSTRGSEGAAESADSFAVDVDPTGNTSTSLGAQTDCFETTAGSDVTVDVTATNIPASNPMIAFTYQMQYPTGFSVTAKDNTGLLSTASGYTELD